MSYYKVGSWNAVCMVCDKRVKADELKKRWDGLWVCKEDWESRHPQDLIRTPRETSNKLPYTSIELDGPDIGPSYVTIYIEDDYFERVGMYTYFEER